MCINSTKSNTKASISTSIPYNLFLYRETLQKRNATFMKVSQAKVHLTDCLILNTVRNLGSYDVAEVIVLDREMEFKKKLCNKMQKIRKLETFGLRNIDHRTLNCDLEWI